MMNARTAWIAIERERTGDGSPSLNVRGTPNLQSAIAEDDWILVATPDGQGPTDSHLIGVIEVTGT